jgi:ATP sulfurylase
MVKASFFSTEPLFFKFLYIVGFLGAFYVLYENIFVEKEKQSGIAIYMIVLFGFFYLRRANVMLKHRKSQNDSKNTEQ